MSSFWLETAPPYQPGPSLKKAIEADVAVVGGGLAGVSTAYHLKKEAPRLRVAVLESEHVGFGASGRNAGFAMTLFGLALPITALRFGKANAAAAYRFMAGAVDYVWNLCRELGIDAQAERTGLLVVATNLAQVKRLRHEMSLARELGLSDLRWLEAGEVRREVNSPTYLGAKYDPFCVLVNPARLVRGLKEAAMKLGVEFYEGTPVSSLRCGTDLVLETPEGSVRAAKAVLATNAYSQGFPLLSSKAAPVHTYISLTRPLTAAELAAIGWRRRQGIEDARNLVHYYRLTPDNRLLMGGGQAHYYRGGGLGRDTHQGNLEHVRSHIAEAFPVLRGIEITHHWGGPVSGTLDLAPAFGYAGEQKKVIYALGCVGHGVSLMTMAGQILRDLALERDTELSRLFFVNRRTVWVPWEPVRAAVINGIISGLKLQDKFDEWRASTPA
ncbi:MAG: FAD-dependent oxidoreductase [Elusimicrobia bacterium]|nr:FAD-dependent oxidoreductase [Elusimicrobiota bacterium]